jgi:hypothetical protein
LFKYKKFISLKPEVLSKIDNWMNVTGDFGFDIWEELFVFDWKSVSNIVEYDGKILIPKKKL